MVKAFVKNKEESPMKSIIILVSFLGFLTPLNAGESEIHLKCYDDNGKLHMTISQSEEGNVLIFENDILESYGLNTETQVKTVQVQRRLDLYTIVYSGNIRHLNVSEEVKGNLSLSYSPVYDMPASLTLDIDGWPHSKTEYYSCETTSGEIEPETLP